MRQNHSVGKEELEKQYLVRTDGMAKWQNGKRAETKTYAYYSRGGKKYQGMYSLSL